MTISLSQAFEQWQELAAGLPQDDRPALAQSWNDYTDSLCKDGELTALQYHYAPAYDDAMPGDGSRFDPLADDRAYILKQMSLTATATFVPFSQSRNKDNKDPSLNWKVTLRYNDRDVITTDYGQGCGHCPAYKNPIRFANGNRDAWSTNRAVRQECETGKRARKVTDEYFVTGNAIDPPTAVEVLHALLLDAEALDAGGFADWCSEYGYSDDSIKARAMYDTCLDTALKLRAAFGEQTLRELNELLAEI